LVCSKNRRSIDVCRLRSTEMPSEFWRALQHRPPCVSSQPMLKGLLPSPDPIWGLQGTRRLNFCLSRDPPLRVADRDFCLRCEMPASRRVQAWTNTDLTLAGSLDEQVWHRY